MSVHGPYPRKDGSTAWHVRWKERGRQHSRSFDRKGDADTFERERRRRAQLGPLLSRELERTALTLDEFVRTGFRTHAATLAPATRRHYRWALEKHLTELLDEPLILLDVPRLASHQLHLLEHGRSPNTVRATMTRLSGILQIAVEHGHLAANPVRAVRKTAAVARDEVRPLAPAQLESVIAALAGRDRIIVALAGYLGLRPKEIRLAAWESVGDGTFTVGRARTKSTAARTRTLAGPAAAFHELRAWRLAAGVPDAGEPIVGLSATGLNQWAWKTLRPLTVELVGRDDVTLYTLRHTHASLLAYCNFTVPAAARRMGHSGQLYLHTYAHIIDALEDRPAFPSLDHLIVDARSALATTSMTEMQQ